MDDNDIPSPAVLPTPKRYPRGIDAAVRWSTGLSLSYWDLWCLIVLRDRYQADFVNIEGAFAAQLSRDSRLSYVQRRRALAYLTHIKDLRSRLPERWSVTAILRSIPEDLVQKESKKAAAKILEFSDGEAMSVPMQNCPRVILERQALRGQWKCLPVDPTPIAERALAAFTHPKRDFFFKGQTFALSRKVDKAFLREMKAASRQPTPKAYEYAVLRAFSSVYTEAHCWDDSYGVMSDGLKRWLQALGEFTPAAIGADPWVFLDDIVRHFIWEVWGCGEHEMLRPLFKACDRGQREMIAAIIATAAKDAKAAYQWYTAEQAERLFGYFFPGRPLPSSPVEPLMRRSLRLVTNDDYRVEAAALHAVHDRDTPQRLN